MNAPSDPTAYVDFAHGLADAARAETLPRFRTDLRVDNKLDEAFDPVTDADREAERAIRSQIETRYPEHGILGEEFGEVRGDARLRWVLDPVDGTRSFVCGVPTWTTLIALEMEGEPMLGVIDQPYVGERWVGSREGTLLHRGGNIRKVATSGRTALSDARISTTDPRAAAYFTESDAAAFARVAGECKLARFSMDAYAYALLATGHLDLVVESGLQHYDYAALAPVVRGAGGVISNWDGGAFDAAKGGHLIAAATPELHAAARTLLGARDRP
ncbi:MAG: histidinol-phosphatase [Nannocystaceae bacterium]|nr:histidinol-phosphatase [Nannocystaceae bacterium]